MWSLRTADDELAPTEPAPETWTVRPGDNPTRIARALFPDAPGDQIPLIAMQIMEANAITRPDRMQPDQVLMVPDLALEISPETEGAYARDSARLAAMQPSTLPSVPPDFSNLFIVGGGLDGYGPGQSDHADRLSRQYPGSTPLTHLRASYRQEQVLEEIIESYERTGRPIDLVGHSWGGPAAYDLALELSRRGIPVRTLVTADPVGRRGRSPLPPEINWVNINADPRSPRSVDNLVAQVGGKPSWLPVRNADANTVVAVDHLDLAGMISSPLTEAPPRTIIQRLTGRGPDIDRVTNPGQRPSADSILRAR